jgi:hypothetical protein
VPVFGGGGSFCGLAGNFGTDCNGLRLINPGFGDDIGPGSFINAPPCVFRG